MAQIALVNVFEFGDIAAQRARGTLEVRSTRAPPLGLLALAAALRQRGHHVHVVDWREPVATGEVRFDEHLCLDAALHVKRLGADVVGFTSRCDTYGHTLATMRYYRDHDRHAVLVLGGPQATITAAETLAHFPFVDLVVRHESEITFPTVVDTLAAGGSCAGLPGLAYRSSDGPVLTADGPIVRDLDTLPIAAYDLFPPQDGEAYVEVGRGCPYACTFCSTSTFFKRAYRMKSAERVLEEVRLLASRYGARNFNFIHDMFTADSRRVLQICQAIDAARLGIVWGCSARIDCLSPELLDAMHGAGCRRIFLGIETGSPRMQVLINKRLDLGRLRPIVEHCKRLGIGVRASFIVGFPDETLEDVEQTLRAGLTCARLGADSSQIHLLSPYPGTPLTREYASRLSYNGYANDLSATESPPDAEVEGYVRAHPMIFSNHFQVLPKHHPLDAVLGLDTFGLALNFLRHALGALVKERDTETLYDFFVRTQPELLKVHREPSRVQQIRLAIAIVADQLNAHILAAGGALVRTRDALRYDLGLALLGFAPPRTPYQQKPPIIAAAPGAVPQLAVPCVALDMQCDPDALLRWIAAEDGVPPPASSAALTALYWTARDGALRVARVPISSTDRRLLELCQGWEPIEAIAKRACLRDYLPAGTSDDTAAAALALRFAKFRDLGLVSIRAASDATQTAPAGLVALPGPEREWTDFSAASLLRCDAHAARTSRTVTRGTVSAGAD
jgi:radical SAM superfamily enzyme YgiQ (UPF0313 family)